MYQNKASNLLSLICNEVLPTVASVLYLAMIQTASLELALISLCVQVTINLIQAYQSYKATDENGRKNDLPMFASKLCMAVIRAKQAQSQYHVMQRRNALYKIAKLQNLIRRIENAKKVDELYDHPLISLAQKIHDGKCSLEDIEGEEFELGSYFSQMGKGCVKGMNICWRSTDEYTQLEFKLNHVARQKLNSVIAELENTEDLAELISLNNLNFDDVEIKTYACHDGREHINLPNWSNLKKEIQFKGLGNIIIGVSPEDYSSYNTVKIQLGPGSNLYDFHGALSLLDLQDSLAQSSAQDIERMKLGQLFRLFNPIGATWLERDEFFFSSTISELEDKMIEIDPSMQKHIKEDKDKLVFKETLGGIQRLQYQNLDQELYDLGARDISAIITTVTDDSQDTHYKRLCNILKMGLISSELKDKSGIKSSGRTSGIDFNGNKDSVFVQMRTKNMQTYDELAYTKEKLNPVFSFPESIRIKFKLEALNSISYQHLYEHYAVGRYTDYTLDRNILSPWGKFHKIWYQNRLQIHDFVSRLSSEQEYCSGRVSEQGYDCNTLMVKNAIGPDLIDGIVVWNEDQKQKTLEYLRSADLVKLDEKGQEFINNILVQDFIQVGQAL